MNKKKKSVIFPQIMGKKKETPKNKTGTLQGPGTATGSD